MTFPDDDEVRINQTEDAAIGADVSAPQDVKGEHGEDLPTHVHDGDAAAGDDEPD